MKELACMVDGDSLELFEKILEIEEKTADQVINDFIRQYCMKGVNKIVNAREGWEEGQTMDRYSGSEPKALSRLALWARRPSQYNHRILRAFFQLQSEAGVVSHEALKARCGDKEKHPDTHVPLFHGHYASMKTDTGNSHGKIFEETDGNVKLWHRVESEVNLYKGQFLR